MRTFIALIILVCIIGAILGSVRFSSVWFTQPRSSLMKEVGFTILGALILLPLSAAAGAIILGILFFSPIVALFLYIIIDEDYHENPSTLIVCICSSVFSIISGVILFLLGTGTELLPQEALSSPTMADHPWIFLGYGIVQFIIMVGGAFFGAGIGFLMTRLVSFFKGVTPRHGKKERKKTKAVKTEVAKTEIDEKWFVPFLDKLDE